jgi:hypothetical protein
VLWAVVEQPQSAIASAPVKMIVFIELLPVVTSVTNLTRGSEKDSTAGCARYSKCPAARY